jgi:hypothetical protein
MSERHRIICERRAVLGVVLLLGCATLAGACGSSKREVKAAKQSVYNADFAVVFGAALEATRELYPSLDDSPGTGAIKTAWHQVQYANNQDDLANQRTIAQGQGMGRGMSPALAGTNMPTRLAYKRYFIRFDVSVVGGRPWRVKVVGHASEWEPGNALPTELHGAARPPWLEGRTDALTVAIYKRIKAYAIPAKEEAAAEDKPDNAVPKTDPKQWKALPPAAAQRLAQLKDALVLRDYKALRAQLADDVVWSLGGAPGADTAMAMWQADPEALDALVRTIESCAAPDPKRVTCPGGEPTAGAWQLVLEPRGQDWKVVSFVKAE